jgi:hypothetical protein
MATIGKRAYAEMYGPTVGDRVRLADTGLVVEVEQDMTLRSGGYGEEVGGRGAGCAAGASEEGGGVGVVEEACFEPGFVGGVLEEAADEVGHAGDHVADRELHDVARD